MTLFLNRTTPEGGCPACGVQHAACGGTSGTVGVDERWEVAAVGGPLKKYRVTAPGGHETLVKLNEADAERYGLTDDDLHVPGVTATEAVKGGVARTTARSGSANKARTASANKGAGGKPRGKAPATPTPTEPTVPAPEQTPEVDPGDGTQAPADDGSPAAPPAGGDG